ncbi:MAG: TIGR01777 family oxidoreductase [Bacteroidetes bacterium]|nr:TIGR01777 family oxidoreductase [Bacteroidota bacterium]
METVLISGGSGLIGKELSNKLTQKGYKVSILSRNPNKSASTQQYKWDIDTNYIEISAVEQADYIIHLAGENIGEKPWTKSRKESIIKSRVNSCRLLFNAVKDAGVKPKTFISASATGYYGAITIDKIFTENDAPADDFLGRCCYAWENETDKFQTIGIRTVKMRTGIVLSSKGGALSKMMKPAKMGFGAVLGNGKQYMPWIHIDDLCQLYINAIEDETINGAYNALAPQHTTNAEFTATLAKTLNKKIWLPAVPSIFLKLLLGEMSDIILNGSRVSSERIEKTSFQFKFPKLDAALSDLLKKQA